MCSLNLNRLLMLFQVNGHQGIIVYCGWADNKKKVQMCSKRHVVCKCLARRRLRQAFVLLVVCWWLLADVALKKQFEAVVALSEQILQVPDPWLWILKRTQTETVSSLTSKDFCDQSNLSQSETWLTHIKLQVNSVTKAEETHRTFMELRSMSFLSGQHWWRERDR